MPARRMSPARRIPRSASFSESGPGGVKPRLRQPCQPPFGRFSKETLSMIRIRNFLPLVALLVGAAILAVPTQAHATFEIRVSTDGGATFGAAIADCGPGD